MPALNELLATWGIAFGDTVLEGDFSVGPHDMNFASGTGIVRFPEEGIVVAPSSLKDQGMEILGRGISSDQSNVIPVLGFYQSKSTQNGGRIVVYGDSNCIDSAHLTKDCWWLMDAILEYTSMSRLPGVFVEDGQPAAVNPVLQSNDILALPQRMEGNRLHRFSKVLETNIGQDHISTKVLPSCRELHKAASQPLNKTAPSNLYKAQKLLLLNSGSPHLDIPDPHFVGVAVKTHAIDGEPSRVDDWLGDIIGNDAASNFIEDSDYDLYSADQHWSFWSLLGIFLLICSGCYITYRYCRHTRRQLRGRIMPARKRLSQAIDLAKTVGGSGSSSTGVKNDV